MVDESTTTGFNPYMNQTDATKTFGGNAYDAYHNKN